MKAFLFVFVLLMFSSCSLNYRGQTKNVEDVVPEITFGDAVFTRYENRKRTMVFSAAEIEQYTGGKKVFAKDISFSIFDDDGGEETTGKCGLLASDTDSGIYELYDEITVTNAPREFTLKANALRWNEKSEQLTGSTTDTVTLLKNNTTIYGSGFSASAVSNSFTFASNVSGTIITED